MEVKQRGISARYKADNSPVTQADDAAEAVLTAALNSLFPEIPVISEENATSHQLQTKGSYFLVDPLDGTREFIRPDSNGAFTVNVGFVHQHRAVGGIILAPARDWLCWTDMQGTAQQEQNGQISELRIRPVPEAGATAVASRSHRDARTDSFLHTHKITRTLSAGSSLKFLLLAAGSADIYPRFGPTMEWDTAAGEAILSAAGGQLFTPDGAPHRYSKPGWRNGPFIACAGLVPDFPLLA